MDDGSGILTKPLIRAEDLLESYLAAEPDKPNRQASLFGLWGGVLTYWMGHEWVMRHANPAGRSFLRLDESGNPATALRRNMQVWDLAELVLNLQHVDGFRPLMVKMRAAKDRDIESIMGELRVGRLLYINGHQFRFVEAPGIGKIHDLEIVLPGGVVVHGETKCKLTDNKLNAKTIDNALTRAVKKFKADVPSVIFVHFPQDWYNQGGPDAVFQRIREATEAFLPHHTRVVAAVFYCEPLTAHGETPRQGHDHATIINRWHKFDRSRDWTLLHYMPPPGLYWANVPVKWIRLDNPPSSILKHVKTE